MESRACVICQQPINLKRADSRTCGATCRKRLSRRPVFPGEMIAEPRWVRWKLVDRSGRQTKLPLQLDGRAASSTDSSTWSDYKTAKVSKVGDGIGWVLGAGIGCIDLDDCMVDGVPNDFARSVLAERTDALFVEVSQSGRGLHLFVPMLEGKGSVRPGIEVYPPDSGRFIALTGNRWES